MAQSSSACARDSANPDERMTMLLQVMNTLQRLRLKILDLHGKTIDVDPSSSAATSSTDVPDPDEPTEVSSPIDVLQSDDPVIQ
eukprot:4935468-Amphidinium_carterae.1